MDNSLDWNQIYKRIFSVYPAKTQRELGEALGVSQDLISNWKTGKAIPTWHVLEKIVTEKHVSWQWLLTGKNTSLRDGGTFYDRLRNGFVRKYGIGITDAEIARYLDVDLTTIDSWKSGNRRPDFETLKKAGEITGAGIDYFVTGYIPTTI